MAIKSEFSVLRGIQFGFVVALTMFVSACSHRPAPQPINLETTRTIGVFSKCASLIERYRSAPVGWIGAQHVSSKKFIKDWKLDDRILDAVISAPPKGITYNKLDLDNEHLSLAMVNDAARLRYVYSSYWEMKSARAWRKVFEDVPLYDLYLVFVMSRGKGGNLGFGLDSHAGKVAHYSCVANIYDPKTRKIIRRYPLYAEDAVQDDVLEDTWDAYSDVQMQKVRKLMTSGADTLVGQFNKAFLDDLFKKTSDQ